MRTRDKKNINPIFFERLIIVCLGFIALVLTFDMPRDAAIFPRIASSLLILLGISLSVTNLKRKKEKRNDIRPNILPWIILFILICYIFLIQVLGFYFTTVFMLPLYMSVLGIRSIVKILSVTAIVTAIVFFVFTIQLGILLPTGIVF